jgi:hypothetical protein
MFFKSDQCWSLCPLYLQYVDAQDVVWKRELVSDTRFTMLPWYNNEPYALTPEKTLYLKKELCDMIMLHLGFLTFPTDLILLVADFAGFVDEVAFHLVMALPDLFIRFQKNNYEYQIMNSSLASKTNGHTTFILRRYNLRNNTESETEYYGTANDIWSHISNGDFHKTYFLHGKGHRWHIEKIIMKAIRQFVHC